MKIETKFNNGDEVLILNGTSLIKRTVHSTKIVIEKNGEFDISYWIMTEEKGVMNFEIFNENKCFASKEEFINQLTEE